MSHLRHQMLQKVPQNDRNNERNGSHVKKKKKSSRCKQLPCIYTGAQYADTITHNLPALWCAVSASTSIRQGVCHRMRLLGFKSDDMKVNCWGPKSRLRTEVPSSQQASGSSSSSDAFITMLSDQGSLRSFIFSPFSRIHVDECVIKSFCVTQMDLRPGVGLL